MPLPDIKAGFERVQEYLEARAIPSDAFTMDKCHLSMLGTTEAWKLLGYEKGAPFPTDSRLAIVIYFQHAEYFQIKWVGRAPREDIGKVTGLRKRRCPCYIPPFIKWEEVSDTLYICESPLKATAMALRGYAAVASNGIWSMWCKGRNKAGKQDLAPSWAEGFPLTAMDSFNRVVILFDSDIQSKSRELGASVRRLGDALQAEFPDKAVLHRPLGQYDGVDQGIDDAIAREGDQWLHDWLADDAGESPVVANALATHLDELNGDYSVFPEIGEIIHRESGRRMKQGPFTSVAEAHRRVSPDTGKIMISASKEWLAWPERDTVHDIVYYPGHDQLIERKGKRSYNNWLEDGIPSIEGDVSLFEQVYQYAIPDEEVYDLLIKSMAWMMQNRGSKLDKLFFCIGRQGTGKSLLTEILLKLYGDRNAISIGHDQLTGSFNSLFAFKEVVALDDLHKVSQEVMARIRKSVTDPTMIASTKFLNDVVVDNYGVFFITSNNWAALPMEHGDRRVLVVHFDPSEIIPMGEDADGHDYWLDFVTWLKGGGDSAVRHWLEHMDLSGFDPNFMPPVTESKVQVTEATKTTQQQWIDDLHESPDMILRSARSAYSAKELWALMMESETPHGNDLTKFGQDLTCWFKRVADPVTKKPLQIKINKVNDRYWLIRDPDMTGDEVKDDIRAYPILNTR